MRYTEHHVSNVTHVISDALEGALALPKFQRPYVWDDKDVCDLLDSMLRGIPIGNLLLWGGWFRGANIPIDRVRGVLDAPLKPNPTLILDGQQRLTALLIASGEGSRYVWDATTSIFSVGEPQLMNGIFPTGMLFNDYGISRQMEPLYDASEGVIIREDRQRTYKDKKGKTRTYTENVVVSHTRNPEQERAHSYIEAFCKARDVLRGTTIGSIVIAGEADVAFARETFRRLNRSGKPCHEAEVFKALECSEG